MKPLAPAVSAGLQAYRTALSNAYAFYEAMEFHLLILDYCHASPWAHEKAHDERHARRDIGYYMVDRGVEPRTEGSAGMVPGSDLRGMFNAAQAVEQQTGQTLADAYQAAMQAKDDTTCEELDHYLKMQQDEDAELDEIMGWLERAGSDPAALLITEKRIGKLA